MMTLQSLFRFKVEFGMGFDFRLGFRFVLLIDAFGSIENAPSFWRVCVVPPNFGVIAGSVVSADDKQPFPSFAARARHLPFLLSNHFHKLPNLQHGILSLA